MTLIECWAYAMLPFKWKLLFKWKMKLTAPCDAAG